MCTEFIFVRFLFPLIVLQLIENNNYLILILAVAIEIILISGERIFSKLK